MKKSTIPLLVILILGLIICGFSFAGLSIEYKPYNTKVTIYSRLEPKISMYSAGYQLSVLNHRDNKYQIVNVNYFTWEKAKSGETLNLTLHDIIPVNPRIYPHTIKLIIIGLILFLGPLAYFMWKGLEDFP